MKTFLFIFSMPASAMVPPSPEQISARQQWFARLNDNGQLAWPGGTLSPQDAVGHEGFLITGLVAVYAASSADAHALAKTNPIFNAGGKIEVRELLSPPVKA
jgi:hypothetical protein